LLKDCKRVFHVAVGGGFGSRQIAVKRGKVLVDCPAESVKNFLFGNIVSLSVCEKRQFAKAIYHTDKIDFEAFFCGKLQVTFGCLFFLFEQLNFSIYYTANIFWAMFYAQRIIDNFK